eukprot:CAMPEP_0179157528 /NCGR_PEP_ID=MMETSP0796-20121207/76836_1 /TAXON_ID=73915 /ORGANISM="Pyrodinium bahamense, Strain pbaha01" /LENGTH=99 /DNA_ID=CAMNT_0020859161 /DNA_START=56 /DNA_END=352 /DNA_ORIENTATION=-
MSTLPMNKAAPRSANRRSRPPTSAQEARRAADDPRVPAEIDVRVGSGPAFVGSPLAHVEVQLAEVASARGLDDPAAPPAATLNVCATAGLTEERCRRAR